MAARRVVAHVGDLGVLACASPSCGMAESDEGERCLGEDRVGTAGEGEFTRRETHHADARECLAGGVVVGESE